MRVAGGARGPGVASAGLARGHAAACAPLRLPPGLTSDTIRLMRAVMHPGATVADLQQCWTTVLPTVADVATQPQGTRTLRGMLHAMCKRNDWRSALSVWGALHDHAPKKLVALDMDVLVACLVRGRQFRTALREFRRGMSMGVQPSPRVFATLIAACARAQQFEEARELFLSMKLIGVAANVHHYNALMYCHACAADMPQAWQLLRDMQARGIRPSSVTYSTLISGSGRAGDRASALRAFEALVEQGDRPDIVAVNSMMNVLCSPMPLPTMRLHHAVALGAGPAGPAAAADVPAPASRAAHLPAHMRVEPQSESGRTSRRHYVHLEYPDLLDEPVGMQGFRSWIASAVSACRQLVLGGPAAAHLPPAAKCSLSAGCTGVQLDDKDAPDMAAAQQLLDFVKQQQLPVDLASFNLLVKGWCAVGWPERAEALLTDMRAANMAPDRYTYNALLASYSARRLLDRVDAVVAEMERHDVVPDAVTFRLLARVYSTHPGALAVLRSDSWLSSLFSNWLRERALLGFSSGAPALRDPSQPAAEQGSYRGIALTDASMRAASHRLRNGPDPEAGMDEAACLLDLHGLTPQEATLHLLSALSNSVSGDALPNGTCRASAVKLDGSQACCCSGLGAHHGIWQDHRHGCRARGRGARSRHTPPAVSPNSQSWQVARERAGAGAVCAAPPAHAITHGDRGRHVAQTVACAGFDCVVALLV